MEKYKYAGQTLRIRQGAGPGIAERENLDGKEFRAEDYWINISGQSWMYCNCNPACMEYALRTGFNPNYNVPLDNKVVYGKVGMFGHLFHESELEE